MNATTHAALILDQHRAAELARRNDILRSRAARAAAPQEQRPTGFAVVTEWLGKTFRPVVLRPAH